MVNILLGWVAIDAACLAAAIVKPDNWLFWLGMRGLPIDFLLGLIIVGMFFFGKGEES